MFNPGLLRQSTKVAATLLTLIGSIIPASLFAQDYPAKPVNFVVPFSAGASPDVMTRQVAAVVAKELGQSVVVEKPPGAGGNLGPEYVAKQQPGNC